MKKLILFLSLKMVITVTIYAQAPQAFKYQAIARDEAGNALSTWDISLRVSLLQEGADGLAVYTEIHKIQTNIYGLIDLIIGEGDIVRGDFSSIKWSENRHYIKMEMDIDGGADYKDVGTSQLYAVPYALYAEQAGNLIAKTNEQPASSVKNPSKMPQSAGGNRNGSANSKFPADGNSWLNVNTGYVGIGTTNPLGKLDIRGSGTDDGPVLTIGNSNNSHRLVFFPGRENDPNPFIRWKEGDPLRFSTDEGGWSEKMRITDDGRVGIGTTDPLSGLHVDDTNGVLFTGTFGEGEIPVEGAGTRMMWYPAKAAFRVGRVINVNWDNDSIGYYSVAMGLNTKATGYYSVAMGSYTEATAYNSTAMGSFTEATGKWSTAMGFETDATGKYSTAMGRTTVAESRASVAMGRYNVGGGNPINWVETDPLFEIGRGSSPSNRINALTVLKNGKVGIGTVSPDYQLHTFTDSYSDIAMFENQSTSDPDGITIKAGPDVNPGTAVDYIIFKDGDGDNIGTIDGNGTGGVRYNTTSDARLKTKIRDYSGGLETVSQIKVRKYEKKSAPGIELIGLLAQELQKVYPQAVSGSPDNDVNEDPMMIDYGRITPLLTKAIQEQQNIIDSQQLQIDELRAIVEELLDN